MGGSLRNVLAELFEVLPLPELLGLALYGWFLVRTHHAPFWSLLLLAAIAFLLRSLRLNFSLYRNPNPLANIQCYLAGVFLYSAALLASWWKNTRGRVLWKGRAYPAKPQMEHHPISEQGQR
jgi:hypothetical protein